MSVHPDPHNHVVLLRGNGPEGHRTPDLPVMSRVLYRLTTGPTFREGGTMSCRSHEAVQRGLFWLDAFTHQRLSRVTGSFRNKDEDTVCGLTQHPHDRRMFSHVTTVFQENACMYGRYPRFEPRPR